MKRKVLFRFAAIIAVIAGTLLLSTSCSNPAGGGGDPPPAPYIITGSGTSFTATRGGTAIPNASGVTIANLMTAIRAHAAGADITIQFGSGGSDVLDIGTATVTFNNTGGIWGSTITLTGSITGSNGSGYTILVSSGTPLSIISTANIEYTVGNWYAIDYSGTGTLTINGGTILRTHAGNNTAYAVSVGINSNLIMTGGTIQSTSGAVAIYTESSQPEVMNFSGGTVQADTGPAISSTGALNTGVIRVSGTAIIRSQNTAASGTISLAMGGASTTPRLIMTGGQVINDADDPNARAIHNNSAAGTMQLPAGHAGIEGKVFERGTEITTD